MKANQTLQKQNLRFMTQSSRSSTSQIKPKSLGIHILATLLIPVPIRSSAEAHSALNIVRDRGLWQWAVVATTVVAFKMASALRKHLWRGGLLPLQWPPPFVLDRAKLGTQKLTQWHRIDVHLWHFISYGVKFMGLKDMSKSFEERTFLNFAGMFFEFEDDFSSPYVVLISVLHVLWTFLYFFKLCTSIRCIEVRKKAVWPGSLFKKTCRRRRPFQHPRKKKAFACYSKAERRVLMMRARAIKARMCSISKIFSPLAITMVFAIERWKKFDEGKYFAIGKVCLLHIFFAHFSNA